MMKLRMEDWEALGAAGTPVSRLRARRASSFPAAKAAQPVWLQAGRLPVTSPYFSYKRNLNLS